MSVNNISKIYLYNRDEVTDKDIEEMQAKVENWAGSDFTISDYSELVAELILGAYHISYLKEDVEGYE